MAEFRRGMGPDGCSSVVGGGALCARARVAAHEMEPDRARVQEGRQRIDLLVVEEDLSGLLDVEYLWVCLLGELLGRLVPNGLSV